MGVQFSFPRDVTRPLAQDLNIRIVHSCYPFYISLQYGFQFLDYHHFTDMPDELGTQTLRRWKGADSQKGNIRFQLFYRFLGVETRNPRCNDAQLAPSL